MIFLDRKYLMLVSARLPMFKSKSDDLYNFRCPFCGDSRKNKLKARGYIHKALDHNGYLYKCWNCNISTNFANFLKHIDPLMYKEYTMEKFQDNRVSVAWGQDGPAKIVELIPPEVFIRKCAIELPSMNQLPDEHFAKAYILNRKIPESKFGEIYFAEDFKKFMDQRFPYHGKEFLKENDPRVVMFYTDFADNITMVNGRSFSADPKLRYIKIKVSDYKKIFGLKGLNPKEKIYITEGEFDSMFLPNAVASGDANLQSAAAWLYDTLGVKPVLIFDKDQRNKQLINIIDAAIEEMWDVCLLPDIFPGKDINEGVQAGCPIKQIELIINENTFNGLEAKLRLSTWRKC